MITLFTLSFFSGCATVEDEVFQLTESDEPAPYTEDEFPGWAQDLRRGEIIFAGSLPFTILLANAGYGVYNLIASGTAGYDITTITSSTSMTNDEKLYVLLAGGALSAGIAIADFIIGLFQPEDDLE